MWKFLFGLVGLVWLDGVGAVTSGVTAVPLGCVYTSIFSQTTPSFTKVAAVGTCDSNCASGGFSYAYYTSSTLNCYCTNTTPSPKVMKMGSDWNGPCMKADTTVHVTSSTFTINGCYRAYTDTNKGSNSYDFPLTTVSSPLACFQLCSTSRGAVLDGVSISNTWTCGCGSVALAGVSITEDYCSPDVYIIYNHAQAYTSPGVAKRQFQKAIDGAVARGRSPCPGGKTACNIPGDEDSFECLDTKTELESCGGCLHGEYRAHRMDPNMDVPMSLRTGREYNSTGVDCTAIPGTRMGGVTCTSGRCEVSACKRGWAVKADRNCVVIRP